MVSFFFVVSFLSAALFSENEGLALENHWFEGEHPFSNDSVLGFQGGGFWNCLRQ